jgi:hypothetical protein
MSTAKIVANTSFQSLANMEDENGFKEASEHSRFFRVGKWINGHHLLRSSGKKLNKNFIKQ